MSSVDDRVVQMKFDNRAFELAVASTINQLASLKKSLDFTGSQKSMNELQGAASRFHMTPVMAAIDGVSAKFLAMSTVAVTALATITHQALSTGTAIVKSLTVAPVMTGFHEYETNIKSIQTILANTQAAGTTLKEVSAALDELNVYSDQTIYNFSEMARNIGTFTAAGVALEPATAAIKGIANLAALSGSNSQQASTAMYQLSQAISAGKVSLMDWNSVVNAGMGGTIFQRALAQTAVQMGKLDESALKLTGKMKNVTIEGKSFRESISADNGETWLSSDVLTKTLAQFTGDLKDAELAAMGFNKEQIKSIQQTAKTAQKAATEVKTLSGVLDTAKESAASGWSQTWRIVFGDFNEAKSSFTGLSNALNGLIGAQAEARNAVLDRWKELGGRDVMIEGLVAALDALKSVLGPIRDAFRDIFPAKTGLDLFKFTVRFREFMEDLRLGKENMENLKRTFKGVFAIFDILRMIVGGVIGVFRDLFSSASEGGGNFLELTGNVGDFLVGIRDAIKNGEGLTKFFDALGKVLSVPVKLLGAITGALAEAFSHDGAIDKTGDALGRAADRLSPFGKLMDTLNRAWDKFIEGMEKVSEKLAPIIDAIGNAFGDMIDKISENMSGENFDRVLDTINTGLFAGLVLLLKKFTTGIVFDTGQGGFIDSIKGSFDALTGSMKSMQTQIQAKTLLMIAGAIALLTASVVALSLIDSDALTRSLTGMTAAFAQLLIAMAIVVKIAGAAGFVRVPMVAASLVLLAGAMVILSFAVKNLSSLSWEELGKGLAGVAGMLALVVLAVIPLSANASGMIRAGAGILLLSVALKIMASVIKDMSELEWSEMRKGLVGVAGALVAIAVGMRLMPKGMVLQAAALLILGAALKVIATAIEDFAQMKWGMMGKGLVGLAGALVAIGLAMRAMPTGMVLQAVALVIIAGALKILAGVLQDMGGMSWSEIGKGLTVLGGALVILAVGVGLMSGALAGAAALVIVAGALAILTPILKTLGGMKWEEIAKGLAALAGVFIIIGLAGLVLTPIIPILLGLGVAIALIGAGVALAGAGLFALSAAITALVAVGGAGISVITLLLASVIKLIPQLLTSFAKGLIEFAVVIGNGAPKIVKAFKKILTSFLDMIVRMTPKIVHTLGVLIDNLLKLAVDNIPKFVNAGMKLLIGLLEGIRDNLPKIITTVSEIIQTFLRGLGEEAPKIVDAGFDMIVDFIQGIADAIDENAPKLRAAGGNLAREIADGMTFGLAGKVGDIASAAANMAGSAIDGAKGILGIDSPSKEFIKIGKFVNEGFAKGLLGNKQEVSDAFAGMKTILQEEMARAVEILENGHQRIADKQDEIKRDRARLEELRKAKKPNKNAIMGAEMALKQDLRDLGLLQQQLNDAGVLYKKTQDAGEKLSEMSKKHKDNLIKLSGQYEKVTEKLKLANRALEDARKQRDDFRKTVEDNFSILPDITVESTLDTYSDAIRATTEANKKFHATLNELVKLGLDDATYEKFISEGVSIQPFLDQLVASGQSGVAEIDKITADLDKSAAGLGYRASQELYQAGVNAAQGLVAGLQKQEAALEAQMEKLAMKLVTTIKRELGIKSPSTVFEEVGKFSAQGLADGLDRYSRVVESSATSVGDLALMAIKDSMKRLSDVISGDLDMTPVIAPVLDLTNLRKDSGLINDILAPRALDTSLSTARATTLLNDARVAEEARLESADDDIRAGDHIEFTQINQSPKALSTAEIYRQTKNQLSIAKGALP